MSTPRMLPSFTFFAWLCSLGFERSALGILGVRMGHRVGKLSVSDWVREKTSHIQVYIACLNKFALTHLDYFC